MEESVISELKSLNNLLRRLIIAHCASHEKLSSLSAQQMHIIFFIKHAQKNNTDVYQRDIENSFNIRPSTATGTIGLLEKNGYIVKENVPSDARLKKLVLTEKSDAIFHNFIPFIKDIEEVVLKDISDDEVRQFIVIIQKMKNNLLNYK